MVKITKNICFHADNLQVILAIILADLVNSSPVSPWNLLSQHPPHSVPRFFTCLHHNSESTAWYSGQSNSSIHSLMVGPALEMDHINLISYLRHYTSWHNQIYCLLPIRKECVSDNMHYMSTVLRCCVTLWIVVDIHRECTEVSGAKLWQGKWENADHPKWRVPCTYGGKSNSMLLIYYQQKLAWTGRGKVTWPCQVIWSGTLGQPSG